MTDVHGLVTRAAAGDDDAWTELVRAYGGALRATARRYRLTDEEAADAAQTTWLLLIRHIGRLRDPARVGGWLMSTMSRECLRRIRAAGRERPVGADWLDRHTGAGGERPESDVLRAERDQLLWRAVDRLPHRQRELVLALSCPTDPSYHQVAHRLSISIGSIGPTRARALRRLRDLLSAEGMTGAALDPVG